MSLDALSQVRFSSRNAAGELRQHVLDFIRSNRPQPGSRLATEAELVSSLKLSRSTVRRALDPLERDGWIDRRAGAGTFVGSRVLQVDVPGGSPTGELANGSAGVGSASKPDAQARLRRSRGIVRVAVLIYKIGDLAHDWYTPGILEGLAEAGGADDADVIVELLGDNEGDVNAISSRLERSRPDALVILSNQPGHAFVIRDAQNLGIPCFVSGTPHRDLNLPSVCEDNRQATRLAVSHLLANGHERVGLVLPRLPEPWVFDRLEAYSATMREAGRQASIHWTAADLGDGPSATVAADALEGFVHDGRLTGLVPCHLSAMLLLDGLVRGGRLSVPGDVSVVSFEQDQSERRYMGIRDADRVRFPLHEMGQTLARMVRAVVAGKEFEPVAMLPATLIGGRSVLACKHASDRA